MSLTSKIANCVVKNAVSHQEIKMESLWAEGPVVITFLRRLGCLYCRIGAKQLSSIKSTLKASNFGLVAISHESEPNDVNEFLEGKYFDGDIYIDSSKKTYDSLEFGRSGWLGTLKSTACTIFKAKKHGDSMNIKGNLRGDGLQKGGTIVVDKGGSILYTFKQENVTDYLDIADMLKTLKIDNAADL